MSFPLLATAILCLTAGVSAPAQTGAGGADTAGSRIGAEDAVDSGTDGRDAIDKELAAVPGWPEAQAAHRDRLAEVAASKLAIAAGHAGLSPEAAERIRRLRVESLVRSGQYEAALSVAQGDEMPAWRGLALAGLGKLAEARPLLAPCIADPDHPMREQALLTLVSSLCKGGQLDRAIELLQEVGNLSGRIPLVLAELHIEQGNHQAALDCLGKSERPSGARAMAADLLRAEALLGRGSPEEAERVLGGILAAPPDAVPAGLQNRARLLLADAIDASGERAKAVGILKGYIDNATESSGVLPAFDRLARIGIFAEAEGAELLRGWRSSPKPRVAAAARLYQSMADGRGEKRAEAIENLEQLAAGQGPIATRATLLLSELWIEDANKEKALTALATLKKASRDPAVAARVAFVEARAHHAAGEFKLAADRFTEVAAADASDAGSFNAALSALMAGDDAAFRARSALLPEVHGDRSRGELALERALLMASKQNPGAQEALVEFLRTHPGHPRAGDAHLALAGLYILDWPPKAKSARESLAAARALDLDDADAEQADYLAFWIEESIGEDERSVALADAFVERWPESDLAPEVRMRQAEVFFRNGDYVDALRHFGQLAADYPKSELADPATFFAGRAAMLTSTEEGSKRALTLWQNLIDDESPLAALARRHQAQLKLRQGEQAEALTLLDAILADEPAQPLRTSTLLLKGEALYVLGSSEPKRLEEALKVFDEALADPEITTASRNEILFRKGKVYEALGQVTEALASYHEVVTAPRPPLGSGEKPEFRWYYRAGFESIRILERRKRPQDIAAAIAIADNLASTPGPRTDEARKTGEQLRLENFIWEE